MRPTAMLLLAFVLASGCFATKRAPDTPVPSVPAQAETAYEKESGRGVEQVTLGGVAQAIYIRGEQAPGPVLLFLHGGPGNSAMPLAHRYGPLLEPHFTVVHWDQRGAGRSFRPEEYPELSLPRIAADTIELTELLHRRFPSRPIALVGHSWGSVVGVTVARQRPDLYCAYIGMGQAVSASQTMASAHAYASAEATRLGDPQALARLAEMNPPTTQNFGELMALVTRFGGAYQGRQDWSLEEEIRATSSLPLLPWEQSHEDQARSIQALAPVLFSLELLDEQMVFGVPVILVVGRHDQITPAPLAERFYETLHAPHKDIVWLEESAHNPHIEQPAAFAAALVGRLPELCGGGQLGLQP